MVPLKSVVVLWSFTGTAVLATGIVYTAVQSNSPGMTQGSGTISGTSNGNNGSVSPNGKSLNVGSVVVTGLAPGVSYAKTLSVGNPNNQDVQLQTVKTVVTGPVPAGACTSPGDVEVIVTGYDNSAGVGPVLTIAKNSSVNLPVTVRMNATAGNGCKGKTFNFTFTVTATSK